jgi:hypothetical protein
MKLSVQIVVHSDNGPAEPVVREVFALDRDGLASDTLGLQLAEAQDLLAAVQDSLVDQQVQRAIAAQAPCPYCGRARRHKDTRQIMVRSLFGVLRLASPRWWHCDCRAQPTRTFQPLAGLLPERTTPELAYLQARFAGLVSYGITAQLLGELLPLGRKLHPAVIRRQTQAVATRLEDELGKEQFSFIDTCQADREELPRPDLPLTVGLDGGYVHSSQQRSRRDGWFEVIAGKVVPAEGRASCFGYVQTYDTKPKRRLFEVLKAHGMTANQQVTFLTDGGEDIRDIPCYLNAQAEHLLDWFHITMRLTVMTNMAKSLQPPPADPELELTAEAAAKLVVDVRADLKRLKWFLWHGNVFRALQTVDNITADLETLHPADQPCKLLTAVREFDTYLRTNAERIPNYGERRRAGEAISTAFTESAVNQLISKRMVKKQQMRWTPRGAHLLLQIRTRVLNDQLADDFHRWHPGFTHRPDTTASLAA